MSHRALLAVSLMSFASFALSASLPTGNENPLHPGRSAPRVEAGADGLYSDEELVRLSTTADITLLGGHGGERKVMHRAGENVKFI
jgi:hypothetical protein